MNEQIRNAMAEMEEWLSNPQELGKKPVRLEIAGEFDHHELHYYIFKFKKSLLSSWKVAVCGGYEGNGLEHCGHVYSEMEAYDPSTAQEKCVQMVEKIRRYWMERAQEQEEEVYEGGNFLGFVLLSTPKFDENAFRAVLKEDWDIEYPEENDDGEHEGTVVFHVNEMMVTIGLIETKVPNGEAEYWANNNFITREESIAAAKAHQAHLIVAVLGKVKPLQAGELYVKVAASCLKASNALGIYQCNTVWLPEDFMQSADFMNKGEIPLPALVFIGLQQDEKGVSCWTNGMRAFGKEELEVINSMQSSYDVYGMMLNISAYLLEEGETLRDGETIGLTADQKLTITLSEGVYVEGKSLKIGF